MSKYTTPPPAKHIVWKERAEKAEAQLADRKCVWKYDDKDFDYACWNASCGAEWYLEEGNPTENNMKFCPECGGNLILDKDDVRWKPNTG